MGRRITLLSLALSPLLATGCGETETALESEREAPDSTLQATSDFEREGHLHDGSLILDGAAEVRAAMVGEALPIQTGHAFRQVGLLFDAQSADELEFCVPIAGACESWDPVEITWREGVIHVGRILLDDPVTEVWLRGAQELTFALIETSEEIRANVEQPTAAELPQEQLVVPQLAGDDVVMVGQASLPDWVVTRAEWGARSTPLCNAPHDPYWITIHHTVTPTRDSISAAARMRGMQAFHMDTNGWCDIGYHFVVGTDDQVYQAFPTEERYGIHVGGHNSRNVGVSMMGTFTSDIPGPNKLQAAGNIVAWIADKHAIPLNRERIRGHREWNSTGCPGDQVFARLSEIIERAGGADIGPGPEPEPSYEVSVDVRYLGIDEVWGGGSSSGRPDVVAGQTFQAELLITNNSDQPIRDVELGYWFEEPYIEAVGYSIQSDHPAYDRSSWSINSADGDPGNPPRDALGHNGSLIMHAFSPRESKRVVVDLVARRDSVGRADHPDVRIWIRNIPDVYGPQDAYGGTPAVDRVGRVLQDFTELDVLETDAWFFESEEPADTEGWLPCSADITDFRINTEGMLASRVVGGEACIGSPEWTSIDADAFDELAIVHRSYDGDHTLAVSWSVNGTTWSNVNRVSFPARGDGELNTYVLPMSRHPRWGGGIAALRIEPANGWSPDAESREWHDVDGLWFQNSSSRAVSSPWTTYAEAERVNLDGIPIGPTPDPDPDTGVGGADAGPIGGADAGTGGGSDAGGVGSADAGSSADGGTDGGPSGGTNGGTTDEREGGGRPAPGSVSTRSNGCAAVPGAGGALWLLVGLFGARRRRE